MIFAIPLLAFAAALPQALPPTEEASPCSHGTRYYWDGRFSPGQRWAYHSRSVDAGSVVTIVEIDNVPEIGEVVHVIVDRVGSVGGKSRTWNLGVEHFAIKRDSLDASVVQLIDSVPAPTVGPEYLNWHRNCVALTYATTVADTLTTLGQLRCEQQAKHSTYPPQSCKINPASPTPTSVAPVRSISMPASPGPTADAHPSNQQSP
jgi:hypothetical protein